MSRRPRRRRGRGGGDALGYALLSVIALVLLSGVVAGAMLRPPTLDPETLCIRGKPPPAHTIILLDATDKLDKRHQKRVRALVENERARLGRYGRLTLRLIDPARPREPTLLFSKCDPGDGGTANPLWSNPERVQERWEEEFGAPLEQAVGKMVRRSKTGADSPILEGLAAAAGDASFGADIAQRRLVLVSDLLEFRRAAPGQAKLVLPGEEACDWSATRVQALDDFGGLPEVAGLAVRIVLLDRDDKLARQRAAATKFWRPLLTEAEAVLEMDPLAAAQEDAAEAACPAPDQQAPAQKN